MKLSDRKLMWVLLCVAFGLLLEGVFIAGVVYSFYYSVVLGLVLSVVWLGSSGYLLVAMTELSMFGEQGETLSELAEEEEIVTKEELIGKVGKTVSALRPMGTIEIDGERMEAKAFSGFIESKLPIVVTNVENRMLLVEAQKGSE